MWIEKLWFGVLRVLTPMGPRYIRPPMFQRIYLLWIFRNFQVLPLQVLSRRQQRFIDTLCSEHRLIPAQRLALLEDAPVLGTVEWRPRADAKNVVPSQVGGGVSAGVAGLADGVRQRS
jgi:hypothetical protein